MDSDEKLREIRGKRLTDRDEAFSYKLDDKDSDGWEKLENSKAELECKQKNFREMLASLTLIKSTPSSISSDKLKQIKKKREDERKRSLTKFTTGISPRLNGNHPTHNIPTSSLGVTERYIVDKNSGSSGHLEFDVRLLKKFNVVSSDSKPPRVGKCVILPNKNILTLDNKSRRIITYTDKQGYNEIKFEGFPCDVEPLDSTRFAVSYFEGTVNIYDSVSCKFIKRLMTGSWGSSGLSYNDGYLYVACGGDSHVRRLHVDGHQAAEVIPVYSEDPVYHIAVSHGMLYYHDNRKLYCSDVTGQLLWFHRYQVFHELGDIVFDRKSCLYVCDARAGVLVATSDGRQLHVLSDCGEGIKHIHYCHDNGRLLVNVGGNQLRLYAISKKM